MAIHRSFKAKPKPRSPIIILIASILVVGFLYLFSSVISTSGFSFSAPKKTLEKFVFKNYNNGPEKYLYWGNIIDCPGKHCGSCAGLGHQESSLRCALEEAIVLQR